jgi:hypothetical protein
MPKNVRRSSTAKVTIKIPRNLYNRLKEIIENSGFDSVTDFTVFVLRDLAAMSPSRQRDRDRRDQDSLTEEEIQAVRKRLKSLGYF